ncbi:MAG TPA: ACT domain-containing protein [Actinobacteria bacterium]|jgi:hypothetical protein|nr:ACT domain-containing protein [Actinomycetota bacterium]
MPIKQLTVFLENKHGRLAEVARILKRENINLQGFSTTEARDYGILRLVVSDIEKSRASLKEAGFTTHVADAICIRVEDRPGELLNVLDALSEARINIDYVYVIAGTRIVLSAPELDRAEKLLVEKGFSICMD